MGTANRQINLEEPCNELGLTGVKQMQRGNKGTFKK